MATTIADASGVSPVRAHVQGDQRVVQASVVDTAYATGGTVITPASVGMVQIDSVISTSTFLGATTCPNLSSGVWSVKVFTALDTEVTNGADLTSNPYYIQVTGK